MINTQLKTDYIGTDFIGQNELRNEINFLVDAYKQVGFLDNILFMSKRGDGKTLICRKIARALGKKTIEINGSSLSSITAFVDQIVNPYISANQDCTLFIDEISSVNWKVLDWLLSVLQYDTHTKLSSAVHDGITHNFNFRHLTFLSATTNPEKMTEALKSRFRRLEFQPYNNQELAEILVKYTPGINFKNNVLDEIVSVSRGSPRHITLHIAEDIKKYLSQKNNDQDTFTLEDWHNLRSVLSINEMGLTPNEIKLLETLSEAPCTLTCLTGKFNLGPSTLRTEIEIYPLSQSLFTINGKRHITPKGVEVLEKIKKRKSGVLNINNDSICISA